MISRVSTRNFKRFKRPTGFVFKPDRVTFLAGGNHSGKSTLLQALVMWEFARSVIEVHKGKTAFLKPTASLIWPPVTRCPVWHTYRPLRAASRASAFRMTSGWRRILVVKSRASVGGKSRGDSRQGQRQRTVLEPRPMEAGKQSRCGQVQGCSCAVSLG
jgi:hypothetical protein